METSAFGVRRSAVALVSGAASRMKIVAVEGGTEPRLRELLGADQGP